MILFIYDLAVLGLRCSAGFSLDPASRCYSLVMVYRLLIEEPSLVAEHRLLSFQASAVAARGLSSRGSQAPEHRLSDCGTWALVQTCEIFLDKWLNQCLWCWQADFLSRSPVLLTHSCILKMKTLGCLYLYVSVCLFMCML